MRSGYLAGHSEVLANDIHFLGGFDQTFKTDDVSLLNFSKEVRFEEPQKKSVSPIKGSLIGSVLYLINLS